MWAVRASGAPHGLRRMLGQACAQIRCLSAVPASMGKKPLEQPLRLTSEIRSARLANNGGYILLHPPAEPPVETGMPLKRTVAPPAYATLTEEEKTLIRQLRNADPDTFTLQVLARKFNVASKTIATVAPAPPVRRVALKAEAAELENMKPHQKKKYFKSQAGKVGKGISELERVLAQNS